MAMRVPDSMPVLTRGKHKRPRNGACLMEYVSVLAGGPFTDAPACTDPTLATIARSVNDYSGDQQRQRLAILASDLTVAGPLDRVRSAGAGPPLPADRAAATRAGHAAGS